MKSGEKRPNLSSLLGTGFHPLDSDYTIGRGMELDAANRQARMDIGMTRRVRLDNNRPSLEAKP